jgi:hypothetical protein
LKERLLALDLALLHIAESMYGLRPEARAAAAPVTRDSRLDALVAAALDRAESMLGIRNGDHGGRTTGGDTITRLYRIRQEGWDRIYPVHDLDSMKPLERELADRRAGEAWYAMRHMETVDLACYMDSQYIEARPGEDGPSFDRLVECAYSLADLASRLVGGDISDRPELLRKRAVIIAAEPIDVGARLSDYRRDRKAAVQAVTADIARAYHLCIQEYLGPVRGPAHGDP